MSFSWPPPWNQNGDRRRSSLPSLGGTVLDGSLSRAPSTSGALARSPKGNSPRGVYGLDPPRPPKEGYEWVWYPEGYWAEREFRPIEFAASSSRSPEIKVWKWRKRSAKNESLSGSLENDASTSSPKTNPPVQQSPVSNTTSPSSPLSPFRTEEAHIQALQSPGVQLLTGPNILTSTSLVESEWLSPKHSLQTPRSSDPPPPAEARPETPADSRERLGFLSKRAISAMAVLQKTKEKAKKYSGSGPACERRSDPMTDSSKASSVVHTRGNSEDQGRKQTPDKEESRRASRLSYIRFPRRAWSERRSFHSTSGSTPAVAESVTPASSNSSVSALRSAFSVIPPVRTASQYPGGEAIRIHTPPLKEDTADGRPRGYFFNVIAAHAIATPT
ncbi:hypothetical protein B0T20DRAFT_478021 [Sordaria brevicollis]|uniref:Uncharacterized protein n=1 Tax=Sordaria brevicollis TaxID=83679 RepID=A0AAE0PHQ1_SORBR|nr:hypothetical protein B0T20DRAFT_478021 [Sordaria brevicollis]